MRRFETIYIASPEILDEQMTQLMTLFTDAVAEGKGEVVISEDWGKKKLAYEVKKHSEGRYVRLEYTSEDPALPHEIERRMRFSEPVIKFQTVRIDNDPKRLVWEAKQAEREKVMAAKRAAEAAAREAEESKAEAASAAEAASTESTEAAGTESTEAAGTAETGEAAPKEPATPPASPVPPAGPEGDE